jgi:hypothetical protein
MPTYPKMLPWLAKKAGVTVPVAEKLWRRAVGDAADFAGVATGPEFHRFALERFIDLLEDECCADVEASRCCDWYWRHQRRIAALSFRTANLGCAAWDRVWKRLSASVSLA